MREGACPKRELRASIDLWADLHISPSPPQSHCTLFAMTASLRRLAFPAGAPVTLPVRCLRLRNSTCPAMFASVGLHVCSCCDVSRLAAGSSSSRKVNRRRFFSHMCIDLNYFISLKILFGHFANPKIWSNWKLSHRVIALIAQRRYFCYNYGYI